MKKIIILFIAYVFTSCCAFAQSFIGVAMSDFSTENPVSFFSVQIRQNITFNNLKQYNAGTVFYGKVTKVSHGQFGKRQAYFEFEPTHYLSHNGVSQIFKDKLKLRVSFYKPFDKNSAKKLAKTGITTAAGLAFNIPMLSEGISFTEGFINPQYDDNRFISGVKKAYKDSPVSYIEKGDELNIYTGQEINLKIVE